MALVVMAMMVLAMANYTDMGMDMGIGTDIDSNNRDIRTADILDTSDILDITSCLLADL
jgi:hypothetical protein